ncbi:AAA family ATPase, partial [Acinetobacter sp. ABJ_C3_5]|uniref:AAA family ATPase n=1 Tax=Acinetobacter courvalinii TaxID=280147 RepID=UPI0037CBA881
DDKKAVYIGSVTNNRFELYNYTFSLQFLDAYYDLQNHGKSLDQLSPGEKGALLLVFYLVPDKEDIPLIIDQPEDNLDNNSVAKVLVPFIKLAKKKRQIILVTHNPNLAVVADSEQVINVSLDKQNGYKFNFISGGIENKTINQQILEVLEGAVPAFCLRKDKYSIT